jgi:hypothetical protein
MRAIGLANPIYLFYYYIAIPPETPCIFMIISCSVIHRVKNVLDKSIRENEKINNFCTVTFPKKSAPFRIMWKNMAKADRPQMKIQ